MPKTEDRRRDDRTTMHRFVKSFSSSFIIILVAQVSLVAVIYSIVNGGNRTAETVYEPGPGTIAASEGPNCRYGVAALSQQQADWLDDFGAGWYLSFNTNVVSAPNNAEFVPVITVKQEKTEEGVYLPTYKIKPRLTDNGLGAVIDLRPGALWIVGNEVDRGPDPGQIYVNQGDTFPDVYARAYHDVYTFIKNRDPLAQVANSALVQVTPGRIQYLDIVWNTYLQVFGVPMPVDVWNMHLYILPEVNPAGEPNNIANIALGTDPARGISESYDPNGDPFTPPDHKDTCPLDEVYCYAEHDDMAVFVEQIVAMRTWMRDHGQQNKPLILSEFSILYPYIVDPDGTCWITDEYGNCFTWDRVINFLNNAFSNLESMADPNLGYPLDNDRLIQQWLWFSVNHQGVGDVSNLIAGDPPVMTEVGQAYQAFVANQPTSINLLADSVASPVLFTPTPTGTVSANLSVSIRNNGNVSPGSSFQVTFFEDEERSIPIGSATVQAPGPNNYGMTGCARREILSGVIWDDLDTGAYRYWVEIDSEGGIEESEEGDNVSSGIVIVNPQQVFTPITARH